MYKEPNGAVARFGIRVLKQISGLPEQYLYHSVKCGILAGSGIRDAQFFPRHDTRNHLLTNIRAALTERDETYVRCRLNHRVAAGAAA